MLESIKYFCKSLISSNYGDVSSSRVTMLTTCAVILIVFIYKNLQSTTFVDFPSGCVYVLIVTLGAKVASSFSEVKKQQDPNSTGT